MEDNLTPWDKDKAIRKAPAPAWLTGTEKLFLYTLNSHDGGERVYPGYATLRSETGIASDATIRKLILSLTEKGWLEYAPGDRVASNEYLPKVPDYVQRERKTAKSGKEYWDFKFAAEPPGYVKKESGKGKAAREQRKEGSTVSVEATTVSVEPATTVSVVKENTILRKKESSNISTERENKNNNPTPQLKSIPPEPAASTANAVTAAQPGKHKEDATAKEHYIRQLQQKLSQPAPRYRRTGKPIPLGISSLSALPPAPTANAVPPDPQDITEIFTDDYLEKLLNPGNED